MTIPAIRNRADAAAALAAARAELAAALAAAGPATARARLAALRVADLVDRTTN